ncbi:MAG: TPM domain-containing protein [Treponema sp.]
MGVTSRSTKKKGDSKFSLLVVMLIVVGIPFLTVKLCTSKSSTASSENTAVTSTVDSSTSTSASSKVDGSSSADETSASSAASSSSENVIGAESTSTGRTDASTTYTDNGYSNSGSYKQTYTKDKDGVYKLVSPVMDTANVLSKTEYNELNDYLLNLDKTTGVQIAVLTVKTLDGEDIASYSMKHAESWHLGQKGVDNGALLTVAMQEHDVRIETGYGTEGTLTDAKCARIIRNVIIPDFKSGDYGEGIVAGVKNMAGIITSDSSLVTIPDTDSEEEASGSSSSDAVGIAIFAVIFFLMVIFIIISTAARALFPHSRFGRIIHNSTINSHHNDTHFGGFGGGGFGGGGGGFSGGGGSFGGGGASGHW